MLHIPPLQQLTSVTQFLISALVTVVWHVLLCLERLHGLKNALGTLRRKDSPLRGVKMFSINDELFQ